MNFNDEQFTGLLTDDESSDNDSFVCVPSPKTGSCSPEKVENFANIVLLKLETCPSTEILTKTWSEFWTWAKDGQSSLDVPPDFVQEFQKVYCTYRKALFDHEISLESSLPKESISVPTLLPKIQQDAFISSTRFGRSLEEAARRYDQMVQIRWELCKSENLPELKFDFESLPKEKQFRSPAMIAGIAPKHDLPVTLPKSKKRLGELQSTAREASEDSASPILSRSTNSLVSDRSQTPEEMPEIRKKLPVPSVHSDPSAPIQVALPSRAKLQARNQENEKRELERKILAEMEKIDIMSFRKLTWDTFCSNLKQDQNIPKINGCSDVKDFYDILHEITGRMEDHFKTNGCFLQNQLESLIEEVAEYYTNKSRNFTLEIKSLGNKKLREMADYYHSKNQEESLRLESSVQDSMKRNVKKYKKMMKRKLDVEDFSPDLIQSAHIICVDKCLNEFDRKCPVKNVAMRRDWHREMRNACEEIVGQVLKEFEEMANQEEDEDHAFEEVEAPLMNLEADEPSNTDEADDILDRLPEQVNFIPSLVERASVAPGEELTSEAPPADELTSSTPPSELTSNDDVPVPGELTPESVIMELTPPNSDEVLPAASRIELAPTLVQEERLRVTVEHVTLERTNPDVPDSIDGQVNENKEEIQAVKRTSGPRMGIRDRLKNRI